VPAGTLDECLTLSPFRSFNSNPSAEPCKSCEPEGDLLVSRSRAAADSAKPTACETTGLNLFLDSGIAGFAGARSIALETQIDGTSNNADRTIVRKVALKILDFKNDEKKSLE
jgi:hypothetical protein